MVVKLEQPYLDRSLSQLLSRHRTVEYRAAAKLVDRQRGEAAQTRIGLLGGVVSGHLGTPNRAALLRSI